MMKFGGCCAIESASWMVYSVILQRFVCIFCSAGVAYAIICNIPRRAPL